MMYTLVSRSQTQHKRKNSGLATRDYVYVATEAPHANVHVIAIAIMLLY